MWVLNAVVVTFLIAGSLINVISAFGMDTGAEGAGNMFFGIMYATAAALLLI